MKSSALYKMILLLSVTAAQVFGDYCAFAQETEPAIAYDRGKEVHEKKAAPQALSELSAQKLPLTSGASPDNSRNYGAGLPLYSLNRCYEIALEKNPDIEQAQNNTEAAILDRRSAQYNLLPSVSYDIGHYFSFGKNIDPVTNTFSYESFSGGYTTLGLNLELFTGFRKRNTIKQLTSEVAASGYGEKKTQLELLTDVTLAYARLLLDKEKLANQRNIIENTSKEIGIINEKIKVGRLSRYEFYTFNARLNTQKADMATLKNDSLAALQDLRQLLNISFKEDFEIGYVNEAMLSDIAKTEISGATLIESILQTHPAIKQAQAEEQSANIGIRIAKSNFLPVLTVGGNLVSNYNAEEKNISGGKIPLPTQLNDNLGKNINISLRIPLFSQLQNVSLVKKERLNVSNAQINVQKIKNSVTTGVLKLLNDFTAAKEEYKATSAALEQNILSYSLYQEKYRLGQISSVELITAQDIADSAASKYIEAKIRLLFRFQLIEVLKRFVTE